MSRIRRLLGYARVSSQEQAQGSSLQDQQNAITSYAKARGLGITRFYVEAESAVHEKIERREQMRTLMAEVRGGDLVLCDKLDRWSRDPEFTYGSVRKILAAGASFYAVADRCDPSTSEGDTALGFRILFAREEHKRIKERMVGTRKLLRDRGYFVEGLPPIGYVRPHPRGHKGVEKNILAVDPKGADLVRKAFRLCVRGRSMSQIAKELELTVDRVHDALGNRLYVGEIQNSQGVWIRAKHEPIIDADLYTKARDGIASRTHAGRIPRVNSETSTWMLRDVARCGRCGAKMSAAYAGPTEARRYYYRCHAKCTSHYVPVRAVETEAEPMIVSRLEELREAIAKGPEPVRVAVVDYTEKRERLQRRRDKYLEAFADEHMSRDALRVKMAKLDVEQLRIDADEGAARKPAALADKTVRRDVLRSLTAIQGAWKKAPLEIRRNLVKRIASAVKLAAGAPPKFVWRSLEDLAQDVRL